MPPADVRAYIAKRQGDVYVARSARRVQTAVGWRDEPEVRRTPSNGEINRELTHLKRMFTLAIQTGKVLHKPYIPMLKESAPRAGFFEPEQFDRVRAYLPAMYRGLVTAMYIMGWRLSEVTGLQWSQVDCLGRTVRLNPGTTKNDEGRVFPFTLELEAVLMAQREAARPLRRQGIIAPWVFPRPDGSRIRTFRKVWHRACRQAGCPGRIPHDFRRHAGSRIMPGRRVA
jgi:integrase